jgi:elongation factor Ts
MVKDLREKTGAGMMDCKKALTETDGDMEKAIDELRKRGQAIANKAGSRAAKEGLIFGKVDAKAGVLLELNCVTDFVARNEEFRALGERLAALAHGGVAGDGKVETLLAAEFPGAGKPVSQVLTEAIAKTGENMVVSRFIRLEPPAGGLVAAYVHTNGKVGVLVTLTAGKAATLEADAAKQLAADLAMQATAMAPVALDRASVAPEQIERERAIYRDQVKIEGKPEKIWEKIIDGKLAKFYKDNCLLEQAFVKDADRSVQQLIDEVGKSLDDKIQATRFVRFEVGGSAPVRPADGAAA